MGDIVPVHGRKRASAQQARWMLDAAKQAGDIFAYERLGDGRWRIETQPTRLEHYRDPDARGVIVLTSREVYAFAEGRWAGRRIHPVNRAGNA